MWFRRQVRKPPMPGLTSVLVTVVFSNCLEVRVSGSDVEVEQSTTCSKDARLNPPVRLPWFCRYPCSQTAVVQHLKPGSTPHQRNLSTDTLHRIDVDIYLLRSTLFSDEVRVTFQEMASGGTWNSEDPCVCGERGYKRLGWFSEDQDCVAVFLRGDYTST